MVKRESVEVRQARLNKLGRLHGLFLLFFSGVSGALVCLSGGKAGWSLMIAWGAGGVHFDFLE